MPRKTLKTRLENLQSYGNVRLSGITAGWYASIYITVNESEVKSFYHMTQLATTPLEAITALETEMIRFYPELLPSNLPSCP